MFIINKELPRFPVIMGATASGKTALALEVAEQLDGEIISADSMQIYRGLNIGTAKPTEEERRRIPHYLIDVADISEKYDVFRFVSEAENAWTIFVPATKYPWLPEEPVFICGPSFTGWIPCRQMPL